MSVLLTEDAAGGDFSITLLSAGFGGSAVIAGMLAPRIGAHADDHSIRGLTLLGAWVSIRLRRVLAFVVGFGNNVGYG
jgi:hypothetical protein